MLAIGMRMPVITNTMVTNTVMNNDAKGRDHYHYGNQIFEYTLRGSVVHHSGMLKADAWIVKIISLLPKISLSPISNRRY